jgi:predicted transcriptional regulator
MSKERWLKHKDINKDILKVLNKNRGTHLTTLGVKEKLKDYYNIDINWLTLNKYLKDLWDAGHIEHIIIKKKNKVFLWKII